MVDKGERPQHHSAEYRRAEYLHFWHSAAVVLRVATQKLLHGCLSKKDRCHLVHLVLPPLSHTCTFQLGLQAPVCCKKKKKKGRKKLVPRKGSKFLFEKGSRSEYEHDSQPVPLHDVLPPGTKFLLPCLLTSPHAPPLSPSCPEEFGSAPS